MKAAQIDNLHAHLAGLNGYQAPPRQAERRAKEFASLEKAKQKWDATPATNSLLGKLRTNLRYISYQMRAGRYQDRYDPEVAEG